MSLPISYRSTDDLWDRFISHVALGLDHDIRPHTENWTEKLGDALLWSGEELPDIIWNHLRDIRVVTIALTTLGLLANSFLFYPVRTFLNLKAFYYLLPLPPFWAVRFATYLFTCTTIIGYGLRAFGRFNNPELMRAFYSHKV